jgi:Na+/proline symporter
VIFFQFSLFLLIGVLLFVYYQDAQLPPPNPPDRIYPAFVWNHLPVGVAGLITAAILAAAMSNLSAALNSLASTTIMDFVKPLSRRERTDAEWLALAKRSTVVWGAILFGIALIAQGVTSVLQAGLSIASVVYGALLGVFLLGVLTKRVGEGAAIAGMLASLLTMIYVKAGTSIAWTWYVVIGTAVTLSIALAASLFENRKESVHV